MDANKKAKRVFAAALAIVFIVSMGALVTAFAPATPKPEKEPEIQRVEYENDAIKYSYYDVVLDRQEEIEIEVPEEDSLLDFALNVVAETIFEMPLDESPIMPNSIILEDGELIIDFSEKIYEANFGTSGEGALLDSIVNAYMENLPEVEEIYISVNGANYSTGHIEIPKDTAFAKRTDN